jgi:hypothetical protein
MKSVKKYTYETLSGMCLGKQIHFTSDCEFFPNFDIKCKVLQMKLESNEIIFTCKLSNGKTIPVGSNMHNLQFEVI